jgi:phosphotriesterase-related protein
VSPEPIIPGIGVHSGQVMTVLGPIPVEDLGLTLTHEHIMSDVGCNGPEPQVASRNHLFHRALSIELLGEVRALPQSNRDNQRLTDVDLMTAEVAKYAQWGGRSIVEVSLDGIGRDVVGLQQISRRTGINIIASAGYYIELSHPARLRTMSADDIADEIVRDVVEGAQGTNIKAGSLGEIGIDVEFTAQEQKNLRAAAKASARTQVPLTIHTPGGSTKSHEYRRRILDMVEEEGADIRHTIMEHVYIRPSDFDSQLEIAARGAFLGYDGISCDFNWGFRGSGPCDYELASDVKRLIDAGFIDRVLLSHDVHLKIMLTAYGGNGYSHILRYFLPRLREQGVTDEQIRTILVDNPRRYFSSRYRRMDGAPSSTSA